jgi:hypothetical protein
VTETVDSAPVQPGERIGRGQKPLPLEGTVADIRRSLEGKRIWLWHYLHADWQWEQSREWHEERYALAVEEVLDLMQGDSGITYIFDTASEFWEPVARHLGGRIDELVDRVREGRIRIVSGQVANARPNQVGEETYIRNLQIGRRFFLDTLPIDAIPLFHSVDIAIGHSQMPQILSLCGFSAYRAWRPHGPMNTLGIPHQFVWEGLDSSTMVVTRGAYGGFYFGDMVPWSFESDWDAAVVTFHQHMLADQLLPGRSNSNQLWAIQGCDDSRPFRSWNADAFFDLPSFVAAWNEREPAPIGWCTPVEFSAAVAGHRDKLPVVRGAIDGCDCSYNAGNSGRAGLWSWRTMNDRRLLRAERWAAIATLIGEPDRTDALTALWRQHCVYQAHAEEFAFTDDFNHLVDLANDVRIQAGRIEQASLQAIAMAAGGDTRLSRTVFNPNAWPIDADVEIYHAPAVAGIEDIAFTDSSGIALPSQVVDQFRHPRYGGSINDQRSLVRMTLPALGYRSVQIVESAAMPPANGSSTTPDGELQVSVAGHQVASVLHRPSGRTLHVTDGSPAVALTFHELDNQNWLGMGPVIADHHFVPESSSWIEQGPLRRRFRTAGSVGPYSARLDVSIPDRGSEIRADVHLEGYWQEPPMTGWVSLTIPCADDAGITVDVPFGVESRDPDHEVYHGRVPDDRDYGLVEMFERLRPGWFWARSWVDASDATGGVSITHIDGNVYWQKDAGRIGPVLLRAQLRTPDTWEARTALSMNGSGVHDFSVAIQLHDGPTPIAVLQSRSAELHHPPVAIRGDRPAEPRLPSEHSFLRVEGPAMVSAVHREGGDLIVRVWENTGVGGDVAVHLDRVIASAALIDLTWGELDQPVVVRGQSVAIKLRPWQIATIRIGTEA